MDKYPLIGKLLIKNKFLVKEDLDKALSKCSADAKSREEELIRYLISTKLVPSKNIEKLLSEAKILKDCDTKFKFGTIAIEKDFISKNNLDFVLEEQESDIIEGRKSKLIGDMLIEAGMITPKQRDLILEVQKKSEKESQNVINTDDTHNAKEPLLMKPVAVTYGLELQIASDFLSAFLIKTDEFRTDCTIHDIKDILTDKDILFGIVTDEMVISFLKSSVFKEKPFRIAKGIPPVHGKDAKIVYFFDTEHLKAGGMKTDGQIDFKDRGKIPQVDKEMVLAEKTPMIEAMDGKNIYGGTVNSKPSSDSELRIGKGTMLSENGLQVFASVKGHPLITSAREICVQEEYVIKGDVDYETGHINYEGDINIQGCIKSGFKVKGHDIKVLGIDDGIIEAQGNAIIAGGINSEAIFVRGNLSAKFIHKSHITCMGDVLVGSEIIDAVIESRGKCSVDNGKIMSSKITSKMGVFAKDIGTEKGKPSVVKVGHDIFTEKELMTNKIAINEFNKELKQLIKEQENKREKNKKNQEKISRYDQLHDTSTKLQKQVIDKMNSLKTSGNLKITRGKIEYPKAIKETLDQLQADIKQAEERREFYFQANKEVEKQIKELGQKIGKQKLKIKNLEFERESLVKWIENNPGKPIVVVSGAIMAKTIIQGEYSKRVLEDEVRNVQVKEIRDTKPGAGPDAYKMDISD